MYQCSATLTSTVAALVPDDVWARLDPRAGGLPRGHYRRVLALLFGLLVLMALAVAAATIGLLYPRIDGLAYAGSFDRSTHDVRLRIRLTSGNYMSERIGEITVDDPSFRLLSVAPSSLTLPAHKIRDVTVRLHIRDCSTVTHNTVVAMSVVTDHWWGRQSRQAISATSDGGLTGPAFGACS